MKLGIVAKVALMSCNSIEDANEVLEQYAHEQEEHEQLLTKVTVLETRNKEIEDKEDKLKKKYDRAIGGEAIKTISDVSYQNVKDVIKAWSNEGKSFVSKDIANYFQIDQTHASYIISTMWREKSSSFWPWLKENFEKRQDSVYKRYYPKGTKKRGDSVIVMGTGGTGTELVKKIERTGEKSD